MTPLYASVILLSCLTLVSLSVLVGENARFPRNIKRRFYTTYSVLILASLSELGALWLNGAPQWTKSFHALVKSLDYILTPSAAFFFVRIVFDDDKWAKYLYPILGANALLQVISFFTGWTFFLDEANYYHHGPLYFLYVIIYVVSIAVAAVCFFRYGKQFARMNWKSLCSIVMLIAMGVLLQEINSDLRTCNLGLAMASVLLYVHYNEFWQLTNDENMRYQKALLEKDPLTNLPNRYAYNEELKVLEEKSALPKDFVFVSIDLNGLKNTNDTLGHQAGDEMIQGAAECIQKIFSSYGRAFRVGGDEFAALIRADVLKQEKIKNDILLVTSAWKGEYAKEVSLSYGFACAGEFPEMNVTELMKIADKRMYMEKARYYREKGVDRRVLRAAYTAICGSYEKILKINLDTDRFDIIQVEKEHLSEAYGFSDRLSQWLQGVCTTGMIHQEDQEKFLRETDVNRLRIFFRDGGERFVLHYRRCIEGENRDTMMEIVPAGEYSDETPIVFLYVKDINV